MAGVCSCMYLGIYDDRTDPVDHIHTETWRGLLFSGRRYGWQTVVEYVCGWILPQTINLATYGVAIGMYANSLWPQINAKWFGIAALSVFFVINLCGVDVMAKVQKILVILLFVALGLFIILGVLQLKNPVFDFTAPDFFQTHHLDFSQQSCYMYIQQTVTPVS